MTAILRFLTGNNRGQETRLPDEGSLVAGRGLRADLAIEDPLISRVHFELRCKGGEILIRDRGSLNGTQVNGVRVGEARLEDGDVIQAGDTRLEVGLGKKEEPEVPGATIVSRTPMPAQALISSVGDAERAAKDLAIVYRVGNIITSERDIQVLCPLIVDTVLEVLEGDSGALLLADEESGELREVAVRGQAGGTRGYSHTIAQNCYKRRACIATPNAEGDERFSSADSVLKAHIHGALCAPVETNERAIGALYVDKRVTMVGFEQRDLDLLAAIGKQAGIAIQNARLRKKDIERERLEHEIEIAANVQRRFLPKSVPIIPGYEIAAASSPSMKVGGDYYDLVLLGDTRLIMVVADVSGHGLAPALMMAGLRTMFHTELSGDLELPGILSELNRRLVEDMPAGEFVTLFAASLDCLNGRVVYAGAGHDPAIVVRSEGSDVIELESEGPPLGILEEAEFPEVAEFELMPGDMMLLYTDGLWEAGSDKGNPLGRERLVELACELASKEAGDILKRLMIAAREQAGGAPHDDITAVVLKRM